MEKRLLKYDAFLEGAMVRAVCEANISFTDEFSETLAKIDSPVSISLSRLAGKDIDVNTNYLGVDMEKDGYATFVPDDKVEKLPYVVLHYPVFYTQTSILFGFKGVDEDSALVQGQSVNLLKRYSSEEIIDEFKKAYGEDKKSFVDALYGAGKELCKVSFEAGGKYKEILCNSDSIKRNIGEIKAGSIKVGKLVTALFAKAGIELKPAELEDFVNKYKSLVKQEREKFDSIKVVSGEEVRKLYNENEYYSRSGTLGSSCMRYPRCSDYLDIYVENEESVSLVVMMRDGLVTARALLWKDVDGLRMMDRIYTNDSSDVQLFINYASANGIWHKKQQNSYTGIPFIGPDGSERVIETAVQLKAGEYERYPYMDTFKFYQVKTGLLFSHDKAAYDYELVDTNGGNGSCDTCGGSGRIDCGECDGGGRHSCRQCDGDGEVDCSTCDGEGKEECDYCNGKGEGDCSTCDGSGKVEGGDGEEEDCSDCGGEGREKCGHCDGEGSRDCGRCDGSGRRDCRYCDGGGDVDCEECGESGQVDCPECG